MGQAFEMAIARKKRSLRRTEVGLDVVVANSGGRVDLRQREGLTKQRNGRHCKVVAAKWATRREQRAMKTGNCESVIGRTSGQANAHVQFAVQTSHSSNATNEIDRKPSA